MVAVPAPAVQADAVVSSEPARLFAFPLIFAKAKSQSDQPACMRSHFFAIVIRYRMRLSVCSFPYKRTICPAG